MGIIVIVFFIHHTHVVLWYGILRDFLFRKERDGSHFSTEPKNSECQILLFLAFSAERSKFLERTLSTLSIIHCKSGSPLLDCLEHLVRELNMELQYSYWCLQAQVILYSDESLITQRPPPEMACIYCNGGVWKIQLFHFYSGIWSRTIEIFFWLSMGQTPSSIKKKNHYFTNMHYRVIGCFRLT